MTPSGLDEIRKRCEARGSDAVPDAFRDRLALLEEVERLQRERDAAWRQHDFVTEREKQIVANLERADVRLALLEPVWEAAKEWRRRGNPDECWELCDAIDAAVAKEGK